MEIKLHEITIGEIADGFADNNEEGVVAYGGKTNVRPPYQREFVYKDKQRDAVINTIIHELPLNVMYWSKNEDGTFEVLDGQQRTISFCKFVKGDFSITDKDGNTKYFHNLTDTEQEQILNYKILVYVCEGTDKERLDWFRTINIAGERLTEQELLNAQYTGTWLASAKKRFSKTGCVAFRIGEKYLKGTPIRQEYLATALDWISEGKAQDYMAEHQHDLNSDALWNYFVRVIEWVQSTFTHYRKEMKGIEWGVLYNKYHDVPVNPIEVEKVVAELMADEDVTKKANIYEYIFSGDVAKLSIRAFTDRDKRVMYEKQGGICPIDGLHYELTEMDAHHIIAWQDGGKTDLDNCVMLSKANHNRYVHTTAQINPETLRMKRDELIKDKVNYEPILQVSRAN